MFEIRYRVYYEDTDASGVVYHARYLQFFERARTDCLRAVGFGQEQLRTDEDVAFTLSDLAVRYRRPARLDDELIVTVVVEKLRAATLVFTQTMMRADDHEILATAEVRAGCVSQSAFKPRRIPESIRKALERMTS